MDRCEPKGLGGVRDGRDLFGIDGVPASPGWNEAEAWGKAADAISLRECVSFGPKI